MSVSAVAPTPFYQDPDRLPIGLPQSAATTDDKAAAAPGQDGGKHLSMFANDDEPSFWDLLDVINPLQHIPVVSNIYRELTGDQIGVGARLVGGTLFGGPVGLIASAVDCMVEEGTGKDTGAHVLALFRDEGESSPTTTTQFAQDQDKPTQPATPVQATPVQAATVQTAVPAPVPATAGDGGGADKAPVIALPTAAAAGPQPLMFSVDGGMQPVAPTQAAAAAALPADANALQALADVKPGTGAAAVRPIQGMGGRMLPTPARNANANAQPLTPITVPVSNSGARSNTPITGRAPAGATANVMAAPRPSVSNSALPPVADANSQTAAGPDWFSAAWGQALDKYQRANQRNDKTQTTSPTLD